MVVNCRKVLLYHYVVSIESSLCSFVILPTKERQPQGLLSSKSFIYSPWPIKPWSSLPLSSLCSVVVPLLWRKLLSKPPASSIFFCLSSVIHFSSYVCVWILCLLGNQKLLSPLCKSEMTKLWYFYDCSDFQCIIFFKWMHFPDKMEIDSQWLSSLNILPFCVLQSEFILV